MAAAQPDPEQVESLDPQDYPTIPAFDDATAAAGPDRAARRRQGRPRPGPRRRPERLRLFRDRRPLAGDRQQEGQLRIPPLDRSPSIRPRCAPPTAPARATRGWALRGSPISKRRSLAERAANKAETSAKPRELAPGAYTVILEPEAVADLLMFLLFSLNARTADEGRSFLSKPGGGNRLGEKLFADGVTLRSDPFNPRNPGTPWAGFGGAAVVAAAAAERRCRPARPPGSKTAS